MACGEVLRTEECGDEERESVGKGENGGMGMEVSESRTPSHHIAKVCSPHYHPTLPWKPSLMTGLKEVLSSGVL